MARLPRTPIAFICKPEPLMRHEKTQDLDPKGGRELDDLFIRYIWPSQSSDTTGQLFANGRHFLAFSSATVTSASINSPSRVSGLRARLPSTPGTAWLVCCRSARKPKSTTVSASFLSIAHLDKSGSTWSTHQLLVCHVISSTKRGSLLPEIKDRHFKLDDNLTEKARAQIDSFIKGPETEDPYISKHYSVGKYGTKLGEIWAALATVTAYKHKAAEPTSINTTSLSNQGSPPRKRPRRDGPPVNYNVHDSDDSGSNSSHRSCQEGEYMEQVATQDLPPEYSVVLLRTRVLNLLSPCTQPLGFQPAVDFRTERQTMRLAIPGVDGPIVAIDDGGLTQAQAAIAAKLASSWNKWHISSGEIETARKR